MEFPGAPPRVPGDKRLIFSGNAQRLLGQV